MNERTHKAESHSSKISTLDLFFSWKGLKRKKEKGWSCRNQIPTPLQNYRIVLLLLFGKVRSEGELKKKKIVN